MTNAKYNCALLLHTIGKVFKYRIQEEAIANAFNDVRQCIGMVEASKCVDKDVFIKLLAAQNSYTLVAHPVSYHHDTFAKGEHSLENKICFQYNLTDSNDDIGRGGNGAGKFVFSLLDWTNSKSPAARRLQYQLAGGVLHDNARLTKDRWKTMFGKK